MSDPAAACRQVEVLSPEAYAYDGECIAKAEELGKPGIVDIRPLPVSTDLWGSAVDVSVLKHRISVDGVYWS
jgi:hypothetical protein